MISEEFPKLLLNAWFADDGNQIGHKDELTKVIEILLRKIPSRDLIVSVQQTIPGDKAPKSAIYCPSQPLVTPLLSTGG